MRVTPYFTPGLHGLHSLQSAFWRDRFDPDLMCSPARFPDFYQILPNYHEILKTRKATAYLKYFLSVKRLILILRGIL